MEFERSVDKPSDSLEEALRRLMGGARIPQAIYVAAKLGIPDFLAGGPSSADELARATDAHAANQDYADRSTDVGTHRAPRTVTLTFIQQGRFPHLAPQASNGRTVYGNDLTPLAA